MTPSGVKGTVEFTFLTHSTRGRRQVDDGDLFGTFQTQVEKRASVGVCEERDRIEE